MRHAVKLIEAVRARPYLYDQSLQGFRGFRHAAMKNRSWKEVAKIIYDKDDKDTISKVKIQWKSLRDTFVKLQRKKQSGVSVRPYIYENEMEFLLPHLLMKDKDEGSQDEDTKDGISQDDEESPVIPMSKFEVKVEETESLVASLSGDSVQNGVENIGRGNVEKEMAWNQRVGFSMQEMHPVDAFFHGIAQTVKQLTPATAARVKKAVANIVMDAEIKDIEGVTTYD